MDIWNRNGEFLLLFLQQIAGGPRPPEINLVHLGLPAILWGILLYIAWHHQRSPDLPREKSLMRGFGLALLSDLDRFGPTIYRLLVGRDAEVKRDVFIPLKHGLAMVDVIAVAGALLSVNQLGIFVLQISKIVFPTPISISFALHQGSQSAFTRARK